MKVWVQSPVWKTLNTYCWDGNTKEVLLHCACLALKARRLDQTAGCHGWVLTHPDPCAEP